MHLDSKFGGLGSHFLDIYPIKALLVGFTLKFLAVWALFMVTSSLSLNNAHTAKTSV